LTECDDSNELRNVVELESPSAPSLLQLLPTAVEPMQQQTRNSNDATGSVMMMKEKFLSLLDDAMDENDLLALTDQLLISHFSKVIWSFANNERYCQDDLSSSYVCKSKTQINDY
jgi:hypothetical protein